MSTALRSEVATGSAVEDVLRVLTSPEWVARRDAVLHDGSRVVEQVQRPDGSVRTVVSRELPQGGPSFLTAFLPGDRRVVQTDEWGPAQDGVRRGTWSVELPGTPARLGGALLLEPTATGSRYVVEGAADIRIPLVGGKAERFVVDVVQQLAVKEGELLRAALSGPA